MNFGMNNPVDPVNSSIFKLLAEKAPYGIQFSDTAGNIIYSNPAHHRMQGHEPYQLIGSSIFDLSVDEETRRASEEYYRDIINRRQNPVSRIARDRRKDGALIDVRIDWDYVDDAEGNIAGIISIITDVTEELHRERELERNRRKNRALLDALPDLMYVFDRQGSYVEHYTNRKSLYYRNPEEIAGKCMADVLPPDLARQLVEKVNATLDTGELQHLDYLLPVGGRDRYFESRFVPYDQEQELVLSIVREITDEREAEEALRHAVEEKSFLMRELNHRVKNNLMMVSSLISLRNSDLNDPALEDVKHQVDTIRMVHEKLSSHGTYNKVELREYLSDILEPVFSFVSFPVAVTLELEALPVPVRNAVSLGLIVNELATNAVKHGFDPALAKPAFSITLEKLQGSNEWEMRVHNTGKPLPEGIDIASSGSLGLQLVSSLVAQLQGTITMQSHQGVLVTMVFPYPGGN